MSSLELARWQFGITTLYHFIFVPLTIGLAFTVALFQLRWHRSGDERWLRATRLWGKLMLISFALGVATGIVQEFQFGMNWSNYSRYVGDIFGAPLAMEGLAAFFVESTFLGLWIFGWGRLSRKVHLATAWAVALSTALSAFFILAANSWMQHPVGYVMDQGKPRLTSIGAVLFNSTAIYAFLHTLLAAALTAGMVVIAVSAWQVRSQSDHAAGASVLRLAMPIVAVAALVQIGVGHFDGELMAKQQPMKMAAADAVFSSGPSKGLSLFATGDFASNPKGLNRNIEIPKVLSFISTGYPNGTIQGINNLNAQYRKRYGPGQYAPIVAVTYWTWRAMIACGMLMLLIGAYGWWRVRKGTLTESTRFLRWLVPAAALPFLASLTGWTFTEMGRQPWAVFGLLKTSASNSPSVSAADVWITLVGFTLLYGVLALFAGRLFLKTVRKGAPDAPEPVDGSPDFVLTY